MARALTSPELALLRSDMQGTKLYLAVYKPNVVYTALLNGAPSSTDRVYQITYDGGSGTLSDVKPNMTLYVGTSAGAHDLGKCRIRKTPGASTFYIGLTSDIVWADNCYLTVVDDFNLMPKHPVFSSGELFMDVDLEYSDQHVDFSPVPVLGSHAVAWLDGATVDVAFDASDSWVFDSTIDTYAWDAPGSSAIADDTTATPTITYDTPGCYRVLCTVTAANGKSTLGARYVFVYDRDANMPATVFQLSQCIADYDSGGWMFDMSMEAEASLSEIEDEALVVLFAEDWYGSDFTKQSIGPILNRENIVCMGRIVGQSIRWDRESGLVHFTVQGFQHWLNKIKSFPLELSFVTAAADAWSEIAQMIVDKALFHLLYYHSTVIETMDFYPSNDTRLLPEAKSIASKLWGQLQDIAMSRLLASPGVDRFGRLFVEVDPQMVPEADRDWATVMALTDDDWQEGIEFQRVTAQECSLISLSTQQCNDAGNTITLYSLSPGHVPLTYGEPEMADRILADTQAVSNQLAGLMLGARTNEFPDVPVNFAMNNRMFDLFPRQFASLGMNAEDNPRGVAFEGNLIPRRIALYFDADAGFMHPEINFEAETFEQVSVNGDIPDSEDVDFSIPPTPSLPSLPALPDLLPGLSDIPFADAATLGPARLLIHDGSVDTGKGLLYSEVSVGDTARKWRTVNAGLTPTQYLGINKVVVCPNGAVYVGNISNTSGVNTFLARAPYIGATFTIIEDYASIQAKYGSTVGIRVCAFNCNKLLPESVVYALTHDGENVKLYEYQGTGTPTARATFVVNTNNSADISYGGGNWLFTASGAGIVLTANAASVVRSVAVGPYYCAKHKRVASTGTTIHWDDDALTTGHALAIGTDNLTSVVNNVGENLDPNRLYEDRVECDPTGQYLMTRNNSANPAKSSDGGATWSVIGSLPVLTSCYFAYAGGVGVNSRWVFGSAYLYYSENFGTSWVDIQGNLPTLSSLYAIDVVKVISY